MTRKSPKKSPPRSIKPSIVRRRSAKGKKPQLLRGMKDVLPQEQPFWEYLLESSQQMARAYGYDRIDVPIVEEVNLFVRSVGEASDIVEKEMYEFTTQGGDTVALRPELTAGICRAYIEHGMVNLPKPVKLWTHGPAFRYDRPQAGRYRQFHQIGWEIFGSDKAALDAELLFFASHLLTDMGLRSIALVNSIGCRDCRPGYVAVLKEYLKPLRKNLCEHCHHRFLRNPLRILDCKEEQCREIAKHAPQTVDHLCEDCKAHFMNVLEYLDESDVSYRLQPQLVRGLDYYSRTVFECIVESEQEDPAASALISGGRYDYLIGDLGGPLDTPAVGMALGMERLILAMKEAGTPIGEAIRPDVFFAQIGETARKASFKIFESLRKAGIAVVGNITKNGLSDQLSLAAKHNARITLILGQKEMLDHTIIVRDMELGSQEIVVQSKLIATLQRLLKK